MASLKDMRVRIASTKATQKITKAMQMVAASKLRRAQNAAEAARPYADEDGRGDLQHRRRCRRFARRAGAAGRHRQGSGASAAGLHRRARPVRRLQLLDRAPGARARAVAAQRRAKRSRFFCVGRKGYEQLRRTFEKQIVEHVDLRSVRQLGFVNAEDIAKKVLARFEAGEFDVCTLFYSRFKSVIAQIPTAQQIIPLVVEAPAANAGPATSYDYEPEEDEILTQPAAAQPRGADLPRAAGKQRLVLRRADERDGQRHPQRRRHDPQADPDLQPNPSGQDHQGAD